MTITGLRNTLKGYGSYFALAICMIGIGACGWLAIGKNISGDSLDSASMSSFIADNTPSYNDTVKAGVVVSGVITESSESPQSAQSTASKISSEEPNTIADFFVLPLTGEILKPYSLKEMQYSATFADWRLHNAIDIAGKNGTTICSAGDGRVSDVYDDAQYGKVVKIDHGNGIITVYCGLSSAYLKKGDVVGINQDIGILGEIPCESADKSHLHFAVIKNGAYISPLEIVKMD